MQNKENKKDAFILEPKFLKEYNIILEECKTYLEKQKTSGSNKNNLFNNIRIVKYEDTLGSVLGGQYAETEYSVSLDTDNIFGNATTQVSAANYVSILETNFTKKINKRRLLSYYKHTAIVLEMITEFIDKGTKENITKDFY